MRTGSFLSRLEFLMIIVVIVLLAAFLRLYALEADAPLHVSIYSGLSNDGVTTVAAARDKLVFDKWSPDPAVARLFNELPGMSLIGFGFFKLLGVGYWQANLISVVTSLLAIAFITGFAREQFGRRVAIFSALLMTTSYVFVVYNRTPIVYTTLACTIAGALFLWGKGIRHPIWFAVSLVVAFAGLLFLKVLGISIIPALIGGLAVLVIRRQSISSQSVIIATLMAAAISFAAYLLLSLFMPDLAHAINRYLSLAFNRSFRLSYGFKENLRFAVQSILQFGIYSSFLVRMLPLFFLSYGYVFYRTAQLASRKHPELAVAEIVVLIYTVTTLVMLMFSKSQAVRYTILLIPPMCLTAALALDKLIYKKQLILPSRFSRIFPILVMVGLAYLIYQIAVGLLKLFTAARLQSGLADHRAIIDAKVLFQLIGIALLVSIVLTLMYLWRVIEKNQPVVRFPSNRYRVGIVALFLILIVSIDLFQYVRWAVDPQYTLLQTSKEITDEIGDEAIIGGTFAYPLAWENELLAFYFVAPGLVDESYRQQLLETGFTHLAIDGEGSPVYGAVKESAIFEHFPELRNKLRLVKTYVLRDNLVSLYEAIN